MKTFIAFLFLTSAAFGQVIIINTCPTQFGYDSSFDTPGKGLYLPRYPNGQSHPFRSYWPTNRIEQSYFTPGFNAPAPPKTIINPYVKSAYSTYSNVNVYVVYSIEMKGNVRGATKIEGVYTRYDVAQRKQQILKRPGTNTFLQEILVNK